MSSLVAAADERIEAISLTSVKVLGIPEKVTVAVSLPNTFLAINSYVVAISGPLS
jgi:hypothetical protein